MALPYNIKIDLEKYKTHGQPLQASLKNIVCGWPEIFCLNGLDQSLKRSLHDIQNLIIDIFEDFPDAYTIMGQGGKPFTNGIGERKYYQWIADRREEERQQLEDLAAGNDAGAGANNDGLDHMYHRGGASFAHRFL
jgi:hypothetical protein